MKVIFLDFDGPIIPRLSYPPSGKQAKPWPPCIAALNRITDSTGAVIVVSSTWRKDGFMKTKERLKKWGVTGKMVGVTPDLCVRESGIWQAFLREIEIQRWMDDYGKEQIESFVILDDDKDMEHLIPFLIHTPFEIGLTEANADAAIKILNAVGEK